MLVSRSGLSGGGAIICQRRASESGQALIEYGVTLFLISAVTVAALILLGPKVGGIFGRIHSAIQDLALGGGDATPVAMSSPTPAGEGTPTRSVSPAAVTPTQDRLRDEPTATPTLDGVRDREPSPTPTATARSTATPTATPDSACAGFRFEGRFYARQWYYRNSAYQMIYGLAWVRDTTPYGRRDALVSPRPAYVRLLPASTQRGYGWVKVPSLMDWRALPLRFVVYDHRWREALSVRLSAEQVKQMLDRIHTGEQINLKLKDPSVNNEAGSLVLKAIELQSEAALTVSMESYRHYLEPKTRRLNYLYANMDGALDVGSCP